MDGLLLFAHGARDPAWARPFEAVAARVQTARPGTPLALAYLEFMTPSFDEAAQALVAAGCRRIHVLPLFLGSGGHVRKDVPALIEGLRLSHGAQIEWQLHEPVGDAEPVSRAMAEVALNLLNP
ncbi:MAG: CbiX/SirB N-terminal domain-containing protein [Paucibacter sp.]|nr:CbiX/SirB N-terminal domain-containing protein [Roseateles sp.]